MIEVVAHRLSTVRHAHQICVLDKGKLAESGTHDETCQKSFLQEARRLAARVRGVLQRSPDFRNLRHSLRLLFWCQCLVCSQGTHQKGRSIWEALAIAALRDGRGHLDCNLCKSCGYSVIHYYQHSIHVFPLRSFHRFTVFRCTGRTTQPRWNNYHQGRGITKSSQRIMISLGNSCWCFMIVSQGWSASVKHMLYDIYIYT